MSKLQILRCDSCKSILSEAPGNKALPEGCKYVTIDFAFGDVRVRGDICSKQCARKLIGPILDLVDNSDLPEE